MFIVFNSICELTLFGSCVNFFLNQINFYTKLQNYFTPCINFFKRGFNNNAIIPIMIGTMVNIKKKVETSYFAVISSIIPPIFPEVLLPMAKAKYQTPNIKAIILGGTNLLTYESPTGETQSSPMV